MFGLDPPFDDNEVEVVEPASGGRSFPLPQVIAIVVTVLVVATGAYALWTGSDQKQNVSAFAPDSEPPTTDSAAASTVATTTSSSTTTTNISTSTTLTVEQGDGGSDADEALGCSWQVPNLVGKTIWNAIEPFHNCLVQSSAFRFEIYTTSEPCTTDPALYDRIGSQSPSPGTPFGDGVLRIDVSFYRNCSTAPPPFVTSPPPDPTTTDSTEPEPPDSTLPTP